MANQNKIRKSVIAGIIFLLIVAGVMTAFRGSHKRASFKFAEVKTGTIRSCVTSSGILHPVNKIEVGTPISGTFSKVYVAYNDVVKKGDVLARIDSRILEASKLEAEAVILQISEKLVFSRTELSQKKQLFESGYLPEIEYLKARASYFSDSSTLLAAKANYLRAVTNLEYAVIEAPLAGTVIECNAKEGQTVVSNFNTPVLFVIAQDLSEMEIHATVDESDISLIHVNQPVEFSVLAYPDSVFSGTVKEIRLHPSMIQNVVNYIVIIRTTNPRNLLLPGMTATIDFIVNMKKDVVVVAKSAVDFTPPPEVMRHYSKMMKKKGLLPPGPGQEMYDGSSDTSGLATLWFIDNQILRSEVVT
ncbi:MAG TPA: efflux RND transporter periplasmic adaptor subunit, partial [Bacteroidales bacterium]|nr:efflux RND transporter periplasmic adaptor subunit [Bacteroidales bacterium]